MNHTCKHLLSPLVVRGKVLKNRIEATTSEPHYLNGPETYPNDAVIRHYRDKAKGAAIVNVTGLGEAGDTKKYPEFLPMTQFPDYDVYDVRNANQFVRLTETIHSYQSLACATLDFIYSGREFDINQYHFSIPKVEHFDDLSEEEASNIEKLLIKQAMACKRVGFDMVSVHCAYGRTLMAQSVSPLYNHREDAYGGSMEGRIRLLKGTCEGIKKMCGEDFLVHILISASEEEGGNTLEDTIAILKSLEHCVDIVQLRGKNADLSHPTGFEEEVPFLDEAAKIKASGVQMAIESVGGFFYPGTAEKAIAEGKVDLVGMGRSWICNPNYGELLYEGDFDEIVPCIRCNKCHTYSMMPPFKSGCSVNPQVGLLADWEKLPFAHYSKKRIAIVGGGPAGMKAAITAADRGHEVTIFEKQKQLGGQICHADFVPFKWPLKDFKNYLIRQIEKRENIRVCLDCEVTPDAVRAQNFDVVFAAPGSEPILPPVEGLREHGVSALSIFGRTDTLGKRVAVIGGGEIGVETGMYLAGEGCEVTVLEMRDTLAADTNPIHYRANFELAWERTEHFSFVLNAKVISVTDAGVTYEDTKTGGQKTLEADSVVIAAGMRAKKEEALAFADAADGFALIGDVTGAGNNLMFAMQSAVYAANRF